MTPCPVCASTDAPRRSGTTTFTFDGITHETKECAALSSLGETVIRTTDGYRSKSGQLACIDCFDYGQQHTYTDHEDLQRQHELGHTAVRSTHGEPSTDMVAEISSILDF